MKIRALTACLLLLPTLVYASNHIDGGFTIMHPHIDITDLYAFPTPGARSNHKLTVVMNLYPGVRRQNHFQDKIDYRFHISQVKIIEDPDNSGGKHIFAAKNEKAILCQFATPEHPEYGLSDLTSNQHAHQQVKCHVEDDQLDIAVKGSIDQVTTQSKGLDVYSPSDGANLRLQADKPPV